MANVTISNDNDFKKIYLSSDDSSMNTNYPVVQIYVQDVLRYTLVVGGSVTINAVTYTTTTGCTDLNYASTVTNIGTRYIEEIDATTFGLTSGTVLEEGVWKFAILQNTATPTNIYKGIIMHNTLDECIANKLDVAYAENSTCDVEKVEALTLKSWALLRSAIDSASVGEIDNAKFKYDLAYSNCTKDCNC